MTMDDQPPPTPTDAITGAVNDLALLAEFLSPNTDLGYVLGKFVLVSAEAFLGAIAAGVVVFDPTVGAFALASDTTDEEEDSTVTTVGDSPDPGGSVSATSTGTTGRDSETHCAHQEVAICDGDYPRCMDCHKTFTPAEYARLLVNRGVNEVRVAVDEGRAVKNTAAEGKALIRYDLMAEEPMEELAKLLGYGANKYAERNWENGFPWSVPVNAIRRHLKAFMMGEDIDPESKAPHVVAIMCNAMFLAEFRHTHPELDDRPKRRGGAK